MAGDIRQFKILGLDWGLGEHSIHASLPQGCEAGIITSRTSFSPYSVNTIILSAVEGVGYTLYNNSRPHDTLVKMRHGTEYDLKLLKSLIKPA